MRVATLREVATLTFLRKIKRIKLDNFRTSRQKSIKF
jgi:hypothetical protein